MCSTDQGQEEPVCLTASVISSQSTPSQNILRSLLNDVNIDDPIGVTNTEAKESDHEDIISFDNPPHNLEPEPRHLSLLDMQFGIKKLFDNSEETAHLFLRLADISTYEEDISQKDLDEETTADLIFSYLLNTFEGQAETECPILRTQFINAANSLNFFFPDIPSNTWYSVQGKVITGLLHDRLMTHIFNMKASDRAMNKQGKKHLQSLELKKRARLPAGKAVSVKKFKQTSIVDEEDDDLCDLFIKCHGKVSDQSNFKEIFKEYEELLIHQEYRLSKYAIKKFMYLKAYDGLLVRFTS